MVQTFVVLFEGIGTKRFFSLFYSQMHIQPHICSHQRQLMLCSQRKEFACWKWFMLHQCKDIAKGSEV